MPGSNTDSTSVGGMLVLISIVVILILPYLLTMTARKSSEQQVKTQIETPLSHERNETIVHENDVDKPSGDDWSNQASALGNGREIEAIDEDDPVQEGELHNSNRNAEWTTPASNNVSNWRCACEGGFLPPGLLKTFGGAEAVIRMSTGQCYHKQT
jgi:hypothetical protein